MKGTTIKKGNSGSGTIPKTILEMAKDLVREQILVNGISPDEAHTLLASIYASLLALYQKETETNQQEINPLDWRRSITKHAIICLECGDAFRGLTDRHLSKHDLNARSYRVKYGIPTKQPLSARSATARRRAIAREVRPWESSTRKRAHKA